MKKRKSNPAFDARLTPSPELAVITGGAPLKRSEAVKKLWAYIKRHGLQSARDKRVIETDGVLRRVFGKDKANMLELGGILAKNLSLRNPVKKHSARTRHRNTTGVGPGAWVHTPGRAEIYRVLEMQGGPKSRRYLLEGPHPSKARVWTRTGRVYLAAAPNPAKKRRRNSTYAGERELDTRSDSQRRVLLEKIKELHKRGGGDPRMLDWAAKTAARMLERYDGYRRVGQSHTEAKAETLRSSSAGPHSIYAFEQAIRAQNPTRHRSRNVFGFGKAKRAVQAFISKRQPFWDKLSRGQRYHIAREAGLIQHDATRAARMSWRSLGKGPLREFKESLQENYKAMTRHGRAVPNPRPGDYPKPQTRAAVARFVKQKNKPERRVALKALRGYVRPNPKRHRRRNSDADSAAAYKVFHGRAASKISQVPEADVHQTEMALLGYLVQLVVKATGGNKVSIDFDPDSPRERVKVCCNPQRTQIHLVGGSQDISGALGQFGVDRSKQFIDLGDCARISYTAKKSLHNFEDVEYYHQLGEETGDVPRLVFDALNKRLQLVGGAYKIKAEGIVN